MATKNFDALFEHLLNELAPPVEAEFGPYTSSIKAGIGSAPGGGYLIGKIADSLSKAKEETVTKEEVVDMISQELYDKVFPDGKNKANDEDTYRRSIQNALIQIVKGIQEKEKIKIPGAGEAVAGYTARIISQLGAAKKEYGARVSKEEVSSAVEKAEEESIEGSKPTSDELEQDTEQNSENRTIVRIENMITDLVDDSGVLEADVLEDVHRKVLASDGLGLEERNVKGFIKSLITRLIDKQILERKNQYLKLGDNFEKYEASKSQGSEAITDDDLIQKYTGIGARKTTGREIWGGDE